MSRYNLELDTAFDLAVDVRLAGFCHIPETDVIGGGAAKGRIPAQRQGGRDVSPRTHHARCRPSGKATTQDTTPELSGLRNVFRILGVPDAARPVCRTS